MLGKDTKTEDNTKQGELNQKKKSSGSRKNLAKSRKSTQDRVKRVMIKKNLTKLREPHKDMIQRTQVTTKKQIPLPYGTKEINQMLEIGHNKIP